MKLEQRIEIASLIALVELIEMVHLGATRVVDRELLFKNTDTACLLI